MAHFKYAKFVMPSQHPKFDVFHEPGVEAPNAGIYICQVCGREIGIAKGHKLPPQTHHAHLPGKGPIRWLLVVATLH